MSPTVTGFYRPWYKVVRLELLVSTFAFMQNRSRTGTVGVKAAGKGLAGTRERGTERRS